VPVVQLYAEHQVLEGFRYFALEVNFFLNCHSEQCSRVRYQSFYTLSR
jgi:hypothetical protein